MFMIMINSNAGTRYISLIYSLSVKSVKSKSNLRKKKEEKEANEEHSVMIPVSRDSVV